VVGGADHKALVIRVLAEARSTVVIHSCFVSPNTVQELMPLVQDAAKRGVQIDMLWGLRYEQAQDWARRGIMAAREAIAKLPADIRSRVRFSDRESGSHAKIIIADSGPHGAFEGFVGSCNWLATKFDALDVSLRLRDPRLVGALAAVLATLRIPAHGEWDVDVHRLLRLRVLLGKQKPLKGSAQVSLIFDREHLALVRLARDRATNRIVSACDLLGPAGETSVFVPMRTAAKDGVAIDLIYNRPTDNVKEDDVAAARDQLERAGVTITRSQTELHGKFLAWDHESICITSFNWLATTPDRWKPRAAEVGVFVAGAELNAQLLARVDEELAVSPGKELIGSRTKDSMT
jgi:phosphatidylserine/phosphatidylglycerophosphate/cardiolipin synthase-like enzyme